MGGKASCHLTPGERYANTVIIGDLIISSEHLSVWHCDGHRTTPNSLSDKIKFGHTGRQRGVI